MRMWMIKTIYLCNRHLLGEHSELHKHRHVFVKKQKINSRMFPIVQIVPSEMQNRHNELVVEMVKRGMNHKSPYEQPDVSYLSDEYLNAKVDLNYNIQDLFDRCEKCRKRILAYSYLNEVKK